MAVEVGKVSLPVCVFGGRCIRTYIHTYICAFVSVRTSSSVRGIRLQSRPDLCVSVSTADHNGVCLDTLLIFSVRDCS